MSNHSIFRTSSCLVLVVIACSLASFTAASEPKATYPSTRPISKPRLTADKQPLPDAAPRVAIVKIPVIGTHLDALPEDVCDKVWQLDSELEYVTETRAFMNDSGIDLSGFNYLGNGVGNFTRTVMDVENGRVRKIILFDHNLSSYVAMATMRKIASNTQERVRSGKRGGEDFVFRVKGVHFYERLVGHWSQDTAEERHPTMNGGVNVVPGRHSEGPCGIEVGITDDDWKAMNVCSDPRMLKAIQDEQLLIGMRPVEAYLAMKSHRLYRQQSGQSAVWTWTDSTVELQGYSDVSDVFGTHTVTTYAKEEHPVARVTFKNGVVDSIEDETELRSPPSSPLPQQSPPKSNRRVSVPSA